MTKAIVYHTIAMHTCFQNETSTRIPHKSNIFDVSLMETIASVDPRLQVVETDPSTCAA